jgi:hypothetical protein
MIRKIVADRLKLKKNVWDDGGAAKRKAEKQAANAKLEIDMKALFESMKRYQPPLPPEELCYICKEPVYWYEGGVTCLWCQKEKV